MRFDDFYKTVYKELSKNGFQITLAGVKKQLLQHPFYPSIQSVTDYLTDLDIPNTVVRIDFEQLKDALTEADVIVLLKDEEGDNLLWIKEINSTTVIYSNGKSDPVETFLSQWKGVALLLQIEKGEIVCLIKPQFEAGREKVGKKGVVRDPKVHEEVIEKICDFASTNGFELLHLDYSPIKGPEGNIEYLLHMRKTETMENGHTMTDQIKEVVDASHADLAKNKE